MQLGSGTPMECCARCGAVPEFGASRASSALASGTWEGGARRLLRPTARAGTGFDAGPVGAVPQV